MITNLIEQLRRDEGEVLHAYQDKFGFWTIGVGRLIDARKGGSITKEESSILLANDINVYQRGVMAALPWTKLLDPVRFGVLTNMAFNMGVKGLLDFKNTLAMIRGGAYVQAGNAMLDSLWAKQLPERANRLAEQMKTGEWQ